MNNSLDISPDEKRDNRGRFTKGNTVKRGVKTGVKHRLTNADRLMVVWTHMRARCLNPNRRNYKNYGGRGIKVCEEWSHFINFYNWACDKWKPGLQLDRIDNDGNYEPGNCQFVTPGENANNLRKTFYVTIDGERMSIYKACEKYGSVKPSIARQRIKRGWSVEDAIRSPSWSIWRYGRKDKK